MILKKRSVHLLVRWTKKSALLQSESESQIRKRNIRWAHGLLREGGWTLEGSGIRSGLESIAEEWVADWSWGDFGPLIYSPSSGTGTRD